MARQFHSFSCRDAPLTFESGMFRTALPEFTSLREFQWIGYPELRAEMVQAVFTHHPNIQSLGLMYAPLVHSIVSPLTSSHKQWMAFRRDRDILSQ